MQFPSALSPDGRRLCLATERRSLACYALPPSPSRATATTSSNNKTDDDPPAPFVLDFDEEEVEDVTPPVAVAITCLQVRLIARRDEGWVVDGRTLTEDTVFPTNHQHQQKRPSPLRAR